MRISAYSFLRNNPFMPLPIWKHVLDDGVNRYTATLDGYSLHVNDREWIDIEVHRSGDNPNLHTPLVYLTVHHQDVYGIEEGKAIAETMVGVLKKIREERELRSRELVP
jgi:hypothetical protein